MRRQLLSFEELNKNRLVVRRRKSLLTRVEGRIESDTRVLRECIEWWYRSRERSSRSLQREEYIWQKEVHRRVDIWWDSHEAWLYFRSAYSSSLREAENGVASIARHFARRPTSSPRIDDILPRDSLLEETEESCRREEGYNREGNSYILSISASRSSIEASARGSLDERRVRDSGGRFGRAESGKENRRPRR